MHRNRWIVALTVVLLTFSTASAQIVPTGSEAQINTETLNSQHHADAAALADGNFVIVWASEYQYNPWDGTLVRGQILGPDGSPSGSEFTVSDFGEYKRTYDQAVAASPSGEFIVVWEEDDMFAGGGREIKARRMSSVGAKIGSEILVNVWTTGAQQEPDVTVLPNGDFVVVWTDYVAGYPESRQIIGRRFDSLGAAQTGALQVSDGMDFYWAHTAAAIDHRSNGRFLVVWEADYWAQGGATTDIQARRFDSDGTAMTEPYDVNVYALGDQKNPTVAILEDNHTIYAWQGPGSYGTQVFGRRFVGETGGAEFQISLGDTFDNQYSFNTTPDADSTPDGGFVVTWDVAGTFDGTDGIQTRHMDSVGGELGAPLVVNEMAAGEGTSHEIPSVAVADNGRFIISWDTVVSTGNDNSNRSVAARPMGTEAIFTDGFESGDTTRWTLTLP